MRIGTLTSRGEFDDLFQRFFGTESQRPMWTTGGYEVPTDVFHTEGALVIRMDLPEVDPDKVEVTVQENTLLVNGTRQFPYEPDEVRFVRRGTFYGDFTQRVTLGKGLNVDNISAHYRDGVLELRIPYAEEVKPRKISIEVGDSQKALS
jgi:HSP20 family protein